MTSRNDLSVTVPAENRQKILFTYDYMGRRVKKAVYGWDTETNNYGTYPSSTLFVYDGWNLIAELSGSSSLVRSYTWGTDLSGSLQGAGGIGGLVFVRQSGNTYYPAYDGNGNVVAMVDNTGAVAASYEYSPYGELLSSTGTYANTNPFRFSTKYADTETGLSYFGYRYYNPETGRWLNRDPIAEWGGVNLYGYVGNNPLTWIDPLGEIYPWDSTGSWWSNSPGSYGYIYSDSTPEQQEADRIASEISFGYAQGAVQGVANTVNKGQDVSIGAINLLLAGMPRSPLIGGFDRIQIKSPQWSRDLFYPEDPFERQISERAAEAFWLLFPLKALDVKKMTDCLAKCELKCGAASGAAVRTGLATNANEAVFWSGIRNGETVAAQWASRNAGATLESTRAARGIKLPMWDPSNPTSVAAWRQASQQFAAGASGNVRVLQGSATRLNSVWVEVEFPALKANPNVKSIIGINPETGDEVLLWSR